MASEISAELALEIRDFLSGIKKATGSANQFAKSGKGAAGGFASAFAGIGKTIAGVAAAAMKAAAAIAGAGAAVGGALAVGLKSAFDLGGKYSDLAAQMGTTAGRARVLAAAFENNGMNAEDMARSVNKMQKSLGDAGKGLGSAKAAYAELGLDPEALIKGDPLDAFQSIMKALNGVEGESKRTALAMDIFGRSGGKLNVLMKDAEAMENARAQIGGVAKILDERAGQFDRASDALNKSGEKVQGFFVGVGAKIIDQIMPAIAALESLDLSGIGERFGAALSGALDVAVAIFQVFRSMSLAEMATLFGIALRLGISKALNLLSKTGAAIFSALIAYFIEGFKNVIELSSVLTTREFWSGMLSALLGIAQVFSAFMLKRISQIITAIKSATGKVGEKIFGNSDKTLAAVGDKLNADSKENFAKAGVDLAPTFDKVGERLRKTGAAMGDAFSKTFNNSTDLINTGADESALKAVADQVAGVARALRNDRDKKKTETGAAGGDDGAGTSADSGLPKLNSRLAGAINTIAGRNANAVIAAEAAKTSANTERTAKAAEEIARNTANNGGGTPRPKPTQPTSSGGRFA